MTISGNYAYSVAFSVTATSLRSPEPVPPVSEVEPGPPPDPGPAPAPLPDLPRTTLPGFIETPPEGESDRAARLFAALDRDRDGSVSRSEFTQGAMELLKREGTRRARRDDGDDDERAVRRAQRLDRRLDRLFDRVDANHDGHIDATELGEALRTLRPLRGVKPGADGRSEGDPTPAAATANVAVVAVLQYTRAGQEETPGGTLRAAA